MIEFKMSLWTEDEEIFRTLYLSETDSNIPLLEAINPLWHPLEIPPNFSEAHIEKKKLIEGCLRITLAWIVKERLKIFNDDDYPFTSTAYKELKPWALFLNAQLNLCEGCFDMFPAGHLPYTSGVQWWQATLWERKLYSISNIPKEPSNIPKEPLLSDKNNYKKRGLVDNTMRRNLASMKGMENPFPPHDPDVQHHRNLIKATFAIIKSLLAKSESGSKEFSDSESDKKECQNFRTKYWEPYKRAYQDWINKVHNSKVLKCCMVVNTEDKKGNKTYKVIAHINGRQTLTLFPIYKKSTLTRRGKYTRSPQKEV